MIIIRQVLMAAIVSNRTVQIGLTPATAVSEEDGVASFYLALVQSPFGTTFQITGAICSQKVAEVAQNIAALAIAVCGRWQTIDGNHYR